MRKLCRKKGVEIYRGKSMPRSRPYAISIPPKYNKSQIMGYLNGKRGLMIFDRRVNL